MNSVAGGQSTVYRGGGRDWQYVAAFSPKEIASPFEDWQLTTDN
jgi:hypothetical protein